MENNIKRACNQQQIQLRKNEICQVVDKMLDNMDYQDITMKTISEKISIARSSLYCYYLSKEEIVLDVLKKYYVSLFNGLSICLNKKYKNREELASNLTDEYFNHLKLLKLSSMYLTDIEIHCSLESVIEFKKIFIKLIPELKQSIKNQFDVDDNNANYIYNFLLMILHSFYPLAFPNSNQIKAMEFNKLDIVNNQKEWLYNQILFIIKKI